MIGNPPFLGGKLLRTVLGDNYVDRLFGAYAGRVPAEADLVVYWFAKARQQLSSLSAPGGGEGKAKRAGLVATNSIRGGANRRVLDRLAMRGNDVCRIISARRASRRERAAYTLQTGTRSQT